MKTITLHAVAFALSLGFATAASAGDFDFGHPDQDLLKLARPAATQAAQATPATPEQAAAQRVAATAAKLQRQPGGSVSTEESRAMVGEDSGSFWLSQQRAHPRSAAAVARLEADAR